MVRKGLSEEVVWKLGSKGWTELVSHVRRILDREPASLKDLRWGGAWFFLGSSEAMLELHDQRGERIRDGGKGRWARPC